MSIRFWHVILVTLIESNNLMLNCVVVFVFNFKSLDLLEQQTNKQTQSHQSNLIVKNHFILLASAFSKNR